VYAVHAKRHDDLRVELPAPAQRAQLPRGRRAQVAQRAGRVARLHGLARPLGGGHPAGDRGELA